MGIMHTIEEAGSTKTKVTAFDVEPETLKSMAEDNSPIFADYCLAFYRGE